MDLSRANNGHVSSPLRAAIPNGLSETLHTERTVNNGEIRHRFSLSRRARGRIKEQHANSCPATSQLKNFPNWDCSSTTELNYTYFGHGSVHRCFTLCPTDCSSYQKICFWWTGNLWDRMACSLATAKLTSLHLTHSRKHTHTSYWQHEVKDYSKSANYVKQHNLGRGHPYKYLHVNASASTLCYSTVG